VIASRRFSFIIPFHRDLEALARCLAALQDRPAGSEVIVAADAAVEDCRALAATHGARVISIDGPAGPAIARNAAAAVATGDVLVFVDADVVVSAAGLARLARAFDEQPAAGAVFGAYDDEPADRGFMSQYKNLSHAFVHRSSPGKARTFWAGFGAVRREAFDAVGGFDERFSRPSVEDIDLGYRLTMAGYGVVLDPALAACHLKRWTVRSAIRSDVIDRGVPWTQLLLKYRVPANDLNLRREYRWSVALAHVALAALLLGTYDARFLPSLGTALAAVTLLNYRYHLFFFRKRGAVFAAGAWLLHLVHHWYNGLSFVAGLILFGARHLGVRLPGSLPVDPWPGSTGGFAAASRAPARAWRA
jgi:GT2 family glycosyltransferase